MRPYPAWREPNPREPMDPQVKAMFETFLAARPKERALDAPTMRALAAGLTALFNVGAPAVPVEREVRIPGPNGEIRALVHAPEAGDKPLPVMVYLHGSGFVIMSPETTAKLTKEMALGLPAVVVSVDYRLAPEHPYPAPLEDCLAAFRWARAHAAELGGDPARVTIGGDSAGGNLAASTALRLIASGEEPPAAVLLSCAWLDLENATPSFATYGPDDPLIDTEVMTYWRDCYAPEPRQWEDPFASPLRAELSAFPPTVVVVGEIDPLCDDGVRFAERLRAAGRQVVLQEHAGMPHVFMMFPQIAGGPEATRRMIDALREMLTAAGAPAGG